MLRPFRTFYEYCALYSSLTLLGIICLTWCGIALPLYFILPRDLGTAVGRRAISAGFRMYAWSLSVSGSYRLDLTALDALRGGPPVILAPNHPCLIDALLILTRHPNIVCVMKAELMRNIFLGSGSRLARYVRNESSLQMVKESVAHLRRGAVLLLFPEGTRTTRAPINPLVASVALIAKHADVAVQTLMIETDSPYLSKGWPLFRRPNLPITYRVRLGRRFPPPRDVAAFTAELDAYYRSQLAGAPQFALAEDRLTMPPASKSHLVLIPSYNPGPKVFETVETALAAWNPVWVIVDGSSDGSGERLQRMADREAGLRVLFLPRNRGKGAAVLHGIREAMLAGFTHALTMDSDGQHPAASIEAFMQASLAHPADMVLGKPVFDASAPRLRVRGRKISNWWANLETLWAGVGDSLYGFRVYPMAPLADVMQRQHWMRRFDFDVEAVVRLSWRGVKPINLPARVRYFRTDEGGVSHFNYWRDNVLLTWMHCRLVMGCVLRLPWLLKRRLNDLS